MTEAVRGEGQPGFNNMEIISRGREIRRNLLPSQVLEIGLGKRDDEAYMVKVWRERDEVSVEIPSTGEDREVRHFPEIDPRTGERLVLELGRSRDAVQPQHVRVSIVDPTERVSRDHALVTFLPSGELVLRDGVTERQYSTNRTFWRVVERRPPEEAMLREILPQGERAVQRGSILETSVRGGIRIRRTPNQDPTGERLMDQGGEMKQTEVLSSQTSTFVVLGVNQELERPRAGVLQTNVLPRVFQALKEEAAQVSPGLSLEEELERVIRGGSNRFVDKSIDKRGREGRPQRGAALAVVAIRGDEIRAVILGLGNFEITTLSRAGTIERWENRSVEDARYQFGDTELSDRTRSFTQFPINRARLGSGGTIFVVNTETYPIPLSSNLDLLEAEGKYHGRVIAITL